jgi:TolA-binding protein
MDQVTKVDNHFMTREFLESQLVQNKTRIEQLEKHIQEVTQRSYGEAAERNRMRNEMQEWTLEAMEHGTIDESTAQEIADICGFELSKEFELEVTVQYSITVNARDEESAQNAIYDIDFDSVSYGEEVTYLSSSVEILTSRRSWFVKSTRYSLRCDLRYTIKNVRFIPI